MAILKSTIPMTGPVGNLSFYQVKGSDRIIVRVKGGPTKKQVKEDPRFEKTRLHGREFAGRVQGGKMILGALGPLRKIVNYNLIPSMQKLLKAMQNGDVNNTLGERRIAFSEFPVMFEGLRLNTGQSLEEVIEASIRCRMGKGGVTTIKISQLVPGLSSMLNLKSPYFRVHAVLAAVPDLHSKRGKYTSAARDLPSNAHVSETTPWLHSTTTNGPFTFRLVPETVPASGNFIWMVSVGIEFGYQATPYDIEPVRREGAGKVIRVVPGGDS